MPIELLEVLAHVVVAAPPKGKAHRWKVWALVGLGVIGVVMIVMIVVLVAK